MPGHSRSSVTRSPGRRPGSPQRVLRVAAAVHETHGRTTAGVLFDAARRAIEEVIPNSSSEQFLQLLFADKAMAVVLELAEAQQRSPINNAVIWSSINQQSLATGNETASPPPTNDGERDVFGGPLSDVKAKMPEVKLPRTGLVKLRSLAEERAAKERYGLTEWATCPVGRSPRRDGHGPPVDQRT